MTWKRKINLVVLFLLLASVSYGAIEDFTSGSWTESDPASDITRSSDTVAVVTVASRDTNAYVYKNQGSADAFGNFEHLVKTYTGAFSAYAGMNIFWGVTDVANDTFEDWGSGAGIVMGFYTGSAADQLSFKLSENDESPGDDTSLVSSYSSRWHTIERSGTTCTAKIYTDSNRTSLEDTLSFTCPSTAYQYVYAMSAKTLSSASRYLTWNTEDLDLQYPTGNPVSTTFNIDGMALEGMEIN